MHALPQYFHPLVVIIVGIVVAASDPVVVVELVQVTPFEEERAAIEHSSTSGLGITTTSRIVHQ